MDALYPLYGPLPDTTIETVFATRRLYDEARREAWARRPTPLPVPGQLDLFDL